MVNSVSASAWRELAQRFVEIGEAGMGRLYASWIASGWDSTGNQWYIAGGGEDLIRQFKSAAERSAVLTGHPGGSTALGSWLELLKQKDIRYTRSSRTYKDSCAIVRTEELGTISNVCAASAEHCYKLQTEAMAKAASIDTASPGLVPRRRNTRLTAVKDARPMPVLKGTYPNRAAWLRDRLAERAWNRNDPLRQRGPDPKTIDKILRGEKVREDVLEKLARALSSKIGKVDLLSIPND